MSLNDKNNKNNNLIKNKDQNIRIHKIKKIKSSKKVISKPIIIYMHPKLNLKPPFILIKFYQINLIY